MARGLSSSVKTELATGNIAPVHLIDLNFYYIYSPMLLKLEDINYWESI